MFQKASNIGWLYLALVLVWVCACCLLLFVLREHSALTITALKSLGMYTSPFALTGSILLFLTFSKMKIHSKIINWIALSAFPIIGYHLFFGYQDTVRGLYARYDGLACLGVIALYGLLVSAGIVILDQVRILVWNYVITRHFEDGWRN